MGISPIQLQGNWDEGYALDIHTISSYFVGYNEFGYPKYNTIRSDLGQLLYMLKYKNGGDEYITQLIQLISDFILNHWNGKVDLVIPMPPSKGHNVNHVFRIAKAIAKLLNCSYCEDFLIKDSSIQAKNSNDVSKIQGTFRKTKRAIKNINVLFVDDTYNTGTSSNECAELIKADPHIKNVYFVSMTIRRVRG